MIHLGPASLASAHRETSVMKPGYRYEFARHELTDIVSCLREHGFSVVKAAIPGTLVERLKASVLDALVPGGKLPEGRTNIYHLCFVEESKVLPELLRYRPYLDIAAAALGTRQMTVHRSAAIIRQPGDGGMQWHSDFQFGLRAPTGASEVLNTTPPGSRAGSMWFYLTGSNPNDGGLSIIPDSHRDGWSPPAGFELSPDKRSIRKAGEPHPTLDMDIPGAMPVFVEPGDLLLFDLVTYHGVYKHRGSQYRLSASLGMRRTDSGFKAPWGRTESARQLHDNAPDDIKPYLREYTGFDAAWRPTQA